MKKILFFAFLYTLSYIPINAQTFGIKGGLNFLNVSSQEDVKLSTSNGFHAGLAVEVPILWPLKIGSGIFYTRRGYKSEESGREGTVSIDYLDIPIDLMVNLKLADLIGIYVSVGPYFSYGITSNTFDVNGALENGYSSDDIDLNRIDSGLNIGTGVNYTNLRLSAVYGISLTDNGADPENQLKNRVLKISLGYCFE